MTDASAPSPTEPAGADPAPRPRRTRLRRAALGLFALVLLAMVGTSFTACSPIYVIRAGIAEAKILAGRRPLPEVIADPATDSATRNTLVMVREARQWAIDSLELRVGDSYTTFTQLDRDTLAMVLSAAYRDRIQPKTWWFPIVGRVPYRGFFDLEDAQKAERDLQQEGYDTWLRPTSAFSTLGWFADPILSTMLYSDDIEVVTTILHEISHAHLFVPGRVQFNESFATFVGRVAAIEFFCTREGGGPDTVWCARTQARWRDVRRFSAFLDVVVDDLQTVYGDTGLTYDEKVERREEIFERARTRFGTDLQPTFEALGFGSFTSSPLNNATLLSRMRYYHHLDDFAALYEREGDLRATLRWIVANVDGADDPFTLLPKGSPPGPPPGPSSR